MNVELLSHALSFAPTTVATVMFALAIAMGRVALIPSNEPRYRLRRERPQLRVIPGRGVAAPSSTPSPARDAA